MKIKDLEKYQKQFHKRYLLKKEFTIFFSVLIAFCGVSSLLYSALVFHNSTINRMRYMTFDGTMFTTLISIIFITVSLIEALKDTEMTLRFVYFMRLSSATTEFIIFFVVMIGLLPQLPDKPDISSYPGVMMHLIIPLSSIICFVFNDAPIGKLKAHEPFFGLTFIFLYAFIMIILFGTKILPSDLAPYSFLDFEHNSLLYCLSCLGVICFTGYYISLFFSYLNRKFSWIWYKNIR